MLVVSPISVNFEITLSWIVFYEIKLKKDQSHSQYLNLHDVSGNVGHYYFL